MESSLAVEGLTDIQSRFFRRVQDRGQYTPPEAADDNWLDVSCAVLHSGHPSHRHVANPSPVRSASCAPTSEYRNLLHHPTSAPRSAEQRLPHRIMAAFFAHRKPKDEGQPATVSAHSLNFQGPGLHLEFDGKPINAKTHALKKS